MLFSLQAHTTMAPSAARRWAVQDVGQDLTYARFKLASQTAGEIVFVRPRRSAGVWLLTILLFPVGLLAYFLGRQDDTVTILVQASGKGTDVTIAGDARPRVVEGMHYRVENDLHP